MRTSVVALLAMAVSAVTAKGIVYDCEKTPQICLNTCWAVKCAKFGAGLHGGGQKTAAASKKRSSRNRNAWGYGSKPCGKTSKHAKYWKGPNGEENTSPDEYPYASAAEGGLKSKWGFVQLRCVPEAEQRSQSGKVSGLGTAKPKDVWTTKWDRITKLPQDWCGPKPTCKNDGHQFTVTGPGVFTRSLETAPEDLPVFEDAVYEANSTTITMRAEEAGELEDVEFVEARDVDEVEVEVDGEEEEESEDIEARAEKVASGFRA